MSTAYACLHGWAGQRDMSADTAELARDVPDDVGEFMRKVSS
jgi:hypothetical protein